MSRQGLLTTSVGSLPKPDYLVRARGARGRGGISQHDLDELARQATQEWITFQEQVGIDVLVDGEQYRGDMVAYFAENLEGMVVSGLVRSYGNRYYKKPIAVGPISRPKPSLMPRYERARPLNVNSHTTAGWSRNVVCCIRSRRYTE